MSDNEEKQSEKQELPDWAREAINKANSEAAKYRTEKNSAVEAAKAEVTDSFTSKIKELEAQIEEKSSEASQANLNVERVKAAIKVGISTDKLESFAELLHGSTQEELVAHAERLKGLFTVANGSSGKATDRSQGSGGASGPLNGDPILDAVRNVINR